MVQNFPSKRQRVHKLFKINYKHSTLSHEAASRAPRASAGAGSAGAAPAEAMMKRSGSKIEENLDN